MLKCFYFTMLELDLASLLPPAQPKLYCAALPPSFTVGHRRACGSTIRREGLGHRRGEGAPHVAISRHK